MNKVLEILKGLGEKWKGQSKSKRITTVVIASAIIISLLVAVLFTTRVEYATLFSNLEPQDSGKIIEQLKADKIQYKIEGTTILVPKDKVDELRMSAFSDGFAPSEKGFELFDQSKFGVTDTEARIMYQRALEGELSRTIESFEEVEKARVHLVLPEETVFTRETEKARASVTLKLIGTNTLEPEKVKSIISLISGSVKNLPKENVEVVDSNLTLLSDNLYNDLAAGGTPSALKQQELEKQFESKVQTDVREMLESVYGRNKVKVSVNADMDFDSKQITSITFDKDNVVERSIKTIDELSNDSGGSVSTTSPVDDGMGNTIGGSGGQSSESNRNETIVNNEIGQTEQKTIKAPGEVKRMTVSVVLDGTIGEVEKASIKNIVAAATGYDEDRKDVINIEALPFNNDIKKKAEEDLLKMQEEEAKADKMKIYAIIGGSVLGFIVLLLTLILTLRKRRNKNNAEQSSGKPSFDVVVGDTVIPVQHADYKPVLSDEEEDMMTMEKEIKGYANKKPDQVSEVIRAWLSEDER
jgi:flagellar M-ring protein FliF